MITQEDLEKADKKYPLAKLSKKIIIVYSLLSLTIVGEAIKVMLEVLKGDI